MNVIHFTRKHFQKNGSIEIIFSNLRMKLHHIVNFNSVRVPFKSTNLFKILANIIYSFFKKSKVNHITGDIHYISVILPPENTILTILDCIYLYKTGIKAKIIKYLYFTLPLKKIKYITTISEFSKNEILKNSNNLFSDNIRVIYVPISNNFTKFEKTFDKTCPTILQIGTTKNKNISNLIESIRNINCKLIIVGKLNLSIEYKLKDYNIFYENYYDVSENELIELYKNCDILSFISLYEGFGMPIIEANSIGRVVLTSNICSMPEIAGNAAHLVDPYNVINITNGILKLITDDQYRNKLIENGYINALRFNENDIANQYLELYKHIYNK